MVARIFEMTEDFRYFLKVHDSMPYLPTRFLTVRKPMFIITKKHIADCALHRSVVANTAYITSAAFRFVCVFYQCFIVVTVTVIYGPVWIKANPATKDTSKCPTFYNIFFVRI